MTKFGKLKLIYIAPYLAITSIIISKQVHLVMEVGSHTVKMLIHKTHAKLMSSSYVAWKPLSSHAHNTLWLSYTIMYIESVSIYIQRV